MFCCPRCSHLSTILNNVVEPESGVTVLFNIVDSYEQCGQQNIVQSCFHQYCINLSVFTRVEEAGTPELGGGGGRRGSCLRCPLPGGARGAKVPFQFKGLPWRNSELSEMSVRFFYEFASENARNAAIELQE